MAATADLCAVAFAVLTGAHPLQEPTPDAIVGLRIGLPRPYFELLHPETRRAVETAAATFEVLGGHVDWVDQPDIDPDFEGFRHVWADLAHHHRDLWNNAAVSDEVAALIDLGRRTTGLDYARSRAQAHRARQRFTDALRNVDVLLTPTTPYAAPRADQEEVAVTGGTLDVRRGAPSRLTVPVNEAALPAVAFPVGTTLDGLPIGAQLIGRAFSDERLLQIVAAYQAP